MKKGMIGFIVQPPQFSYFTYKKIIHYINIFKFGVQNDITLILLYHSVFN